MTADTFVNAEHASKDLPASPRKANGPAPIDDSALEAGPEIASNRTPFPDLEVPPDAPDELTLPAAGPQEVLDDIASLIISPDDSVLSGTREILTRVGVRKPKKDEFFRT